MIFNIIKLLSSIVNLPRVLTRIWTAFNQKRLERQVVKSAARIKALEVKVSVNEDNLRRREAAEEDAKNKSIASIERHFSKPLR